MPNLYVIAGANGAGKTTASYTILPELLNCKEFVNADEIAKGLSPFQPDKVAIEAGRLMLGRIKDLRSNREDFAFETTLSTKSYVSFIKEAQDQGYFVSLLYFWLNSPELAIQRVQKRVASGGHNIPIDIIRRRYTAGILNLSKLYMPVCDYWMLIDNSERPSSSIAEGMKNENSIVYNKSIYKKILSI